MIYLIIFVLFAFAPGVSDAYMMGKDNRYVVNVNKQMVSPFRQTGQIQIYGEAFVTGILMGKNCDVVLSAGHAAIYWQTVERKNWRQGQLRGQGRFVFSLTPQEKNSFIKMKLIRSGYEDLANLDFDQHDWSLFRLETPAWDECEDFSITRVSNDCPETLIMPAFHFDKPENLLVDRTCRVKGSLEHGIIIHNCDTKEGSSGAPLFCKRDDKFELLGINISGLTQKEYQDPGVYGIEGSEFHPKWHKNHAVVIDGEFYQVLKQELIDSEIRAKLNKQ